MARRRKSPLKPALGVIGLLLTLAVAALVQVLQPAPAAAPVTEDGVTVLFSPRGGCTDAIVREIDNAQKSIQVQAYSFTSVPIAEALLAAHRRGVQVTVLLDEHAAGDQYSSAKFFLNQRIPVSIDPKHPIAHNKIMILDSRTIITGSFNFTKQAEQGNAENLLIIRDKPKLLEAYQRNFEHHFGHAEAYDGAASGAGKSGRG